MRLLCALAFALLAATACAVDADQVTDAAPIGSSVEATPTPAPSDPVEPTIEPTIEPTVEPTGEPTQVPAPTQVPTPAATEAPIDAAADLDSLTFTTSFGFCFGYCRDTLSFDGQSVLLTSESPDGDVVINRSELDPATGSMLAQAVRELMTTELAEIYGCPDCADGGASTITLNRSTHTYDFANPPPEFESLDRVVMSLREALRSCESNELVIVATDCSRTDGG